MYSLIFIFPLNLTFEEKGQILVWYPKQIIYIELNSSFNFPMTLNLKCKVSTSIEPKTNSYSTIWIMGLTFYKIHNQY